MNECMGNTAIAHSEGKRKVLVVSFNYEGVV